MATVAASLTLRSKSPAQTRRIGARLGRLLQAGDILLLSGELGSGKTCLVQGIGRGLAVSDPVTSKSFVLLGEYRGRLTLYHGDLYRLEDPLEVEELALTECCADGALVVEWADRAWEVFPPEHLLVRLEIGGASERDLTLAAHGERYERLLAAIAGGRRRRS
ncbi:MAG: tRNA (adenosine(37)-N6)-threonylcarbamoyltransferase complex ATPase subunit type 1 TsaE [Dehalococcoidia bacterium]|nr:tRNA (adenosine(37)-N6)-threonylcarbamoyltransferase complex ATPase subunit type 1 TsaE [Dehalococcoidia bacterium]